MPNELTEQLRGATLLCPAHGNAACPEEYMLGLDGRPGAFYVDHWVESMRCGQRPNADDVIDTIERLTAALELIAGRRGPVALRQPRLDRELQQIATEALSDE